MIDPIMFRQRIGNYFNSKKTKSHYEKVNSNYPRQHGSTGNVLNDIMCVILLMIYTYILCILVALVLKTSLNHNKYYNTVSETYVTGVGTTKLRDHLNNLLLIIILYAFKVSSKNTPGSTMVVVKRIFGLGRKNYSNLYISLWVALINSILIIICNPAITNPGPGGHQEKTKLSILYHNIRGFVSPNELGESDPVLNINKLFELQSYIYDKKPDIVILNETWLSKNINDSEILPNQSYKIFRLDRSQNTHPSDPGDPDEYKKNGGGVLIAVKTDLNCESVLIKDKCKAEILSVELCLGNGKSIYISTLYRVGTLGAANHRAVDNYLREIMKRKKINKVVLTGDLNLNQVSWQDNSTTSKLQNKFIQTFNDLNLEQLINQPTHKNGNILDILLTNSPEIISDIEVTEENEICKSDHFGILFFVDIKVSRKKSRKRKIFNFKKAKWDDLNNKLRHVNWNHILKHCDADTAWYNFKNKLFELCHAHIPTITIQNDFQPPGLTVIHTNSVKKRKI